MNCFWLTGTSTPPAPSTINQSLIKLLGMLIRPRSISTPAQRAARSGETGGTNLYTSSSRSLPAATLSATSNTGVVPMDPHQDVANHAPMNLACYHRLAKTCRRDIRSDTGLRLLSDRVRFDRPLVKCYKSAFCVQL